MKITSTSFIQIFKRNSFSVFNFASKLLFVCSVILSLSLSSCDDDGDDMKSEQEEKKEELQTLTEGTVWKGPKITFTQSSSNTTDKITDKVWITRGSAGQIFNSKLEKSADKEASPKGTLWAKGEAKDWKTLKFGKFRQALGKPKDILNKNLVLYLVEEKIFIDIKITSWASGKERAAFVYTRSSKAADTKNESGSADGGNQENSGGNTGGNEGGETDSGNSGGSDGGSSAGSEEETTETSAATVWTGDKITFTKTADNPVDKITDKVWLTRGSGGQIFNKKTEDAATKNTSPKGTRWAEGAAKDWKTLTFGTFRSLGKPNTFVGKKMVMHLQEDNIYIDVEFTSWDVGKTTNKRGGFAYKRSSKN